MYRVTKDFKDHLKQLQPYKVGDAYEEQQEIWTKYLLDNGFIEQVVLEKKEKKFFSKADNEDVAEKQN